MAVTNVVKLGLGGGITMECGTFTHTVGGAEETHVVATGTVYAFFVSPMSSSEKFDAGASLFSKSTSGAITTITIHKLAGVAAGTYCLIYGN